MSYNLVDPTTGDLTKVAGNIRQDIIPADASASNKLATVDSTLKTIQLSGSVDCNTLTEPGLYIASAGAVISITNTPANIGSAVQLDGGFSILVTKTNVASVYYGMQMFIPYGSDMPFIRKAYYFNNGQYWTSWEQLATMDKLNFTHLGTITEVNVGSHKTLDILVDWKEIYVEARVSDQYTFTTTVPKASIGRNILFGCSMGYAEVNIVGDKIYGYGGMYNNTNTSVTYDVWYR